MADEMNWITATRVFIVAWLIVPVAWNIVAWSAAGDDATISYVVVRFSREHPWVPFSLGLVVGMLGGHWFWPLGGE